MRVKIIHTLCVEDNPDDFILLQEMLNEDKLSIHKVEQAFSLAEGLSRVAKRDMDVVLLDLSLPDSVGLDTFLEMKQEAPDLPIIVMTGLDDNRLAVHAVREGAQDYLVKGKFDAELITRTIRHAIEREKLLVHLRAAREHIKTLTGLIPICASCKQIRDDKGFWTHVECYISEHADVQFTHGICPVCAKRLYPDIELYPCSQN